MDKKDLFYVVIQGTNRRVHNPSGTPLIVRLEFIMHILEKYGQPYVKIPVEEFERTFIQQDEKHTKILDMSDEDCYMMCAKDINNTVKEGIND